ncbi:peptidylprolyl isomerase [Tenacibaculum aestuariivivum]|uniref:peptidylprolyl isomerase n=1 Tax=Tenacibaculum aestuariivivum TaxID=2006131 RepID=UPI003AB7B438
MRHYFLFLVILLTTNYSFAQKDKVLLRINNLPVKVSEFKQVYEKNLALLEEDAKKIDNYLELFIDYKLKVQEAYALKLDTLASFKKELLAYEKQLMVPYLQNDAYIAKLVKQAYNRQLNEVKVSHILVKYSKKEGSFDTLTIYKKINNLRNKILKGVPFKMVANEFSDDPSVKSNGGDLGYFSAFSMVYPFENVAYSTGLNQISKPFKTKFGYHILKVTGKRVSKGTFEVAHILVKNSAESNQKITSIYQKLKTGMPFEKLAQQYSEDLGTASIGGKLPKFGTGVMVESFENQVREISKEGDYTKPFKTKFGWHIVKLIKKYPLGSFNTVKDALTLKVKQSNRIALSKQTILDKLKREYTIKEYKKALVIFLNSDIKQLKAQNLTQVLLIINKEKITQKSFYNFIKYKYNEPIDVLYNKFKNNQILNYFKNNLINTNIEYKNSLLSYKEGMLLFEVMQKKIWNRALNDSIGLQQFYNINKLKYQSKKFENVKGYVINDYQKKIEKEWISELRNKSKIEIKERELNKFKKIYKQ